MSPSARPSPTGTHSAADELPRRAARVAAHAARPRLEVCGAQLALESTPLGLLDVALGPFTPVRALEVCLRSQSTHRGRDAARAWAEQPDQLEFEYVFPGARVLQRVHVARERAAAWMELDVACQGALELELRFAVASHADALDGALEPRLERDDHTGAAALLHRSQGWALLVGSPEAEPFELRSASEGERIAVLRLPCSPARAALGPLVVLLAGALGGVEPLEQARETQRWIARHWSSERTALANAWRAWLAAPMQLSSSSAELQQRMLWAKVEARRAALRTAQLAQSADATGKANAMQPDLRAQCERAARRALELCSQAPEASELASTDSGGVGGLLGRLQRAQAELRAVLQEACAPAASAADGVLVLRPHFTRGPDATRLDGVQVGATRFDLELRRERTAEGRSTLTLALENWSGPPLKVLFRPSLPPLSRAALEDGRPVELREHDGELVAQVLARSVQGPVEWRLSAECGPELNPRGAELAVQQLECGAQHVTWRLSVPAGNDLRLPWRSDRAVRFEGDASSHGAELHLHVPRPGRDGLSTLTLRALALD